MGQALNKLAGDIAEMVRSLFLSTFPSVSLSLLLLNHFLSFY